MTTNIRNDIDKITIDLETVEVNEKENYVFDKKYRDPISESYMKGNDSELKTTEEEVEVNPVETSDDYTNVKIDEE